MEAQCTVHKEKNFVQNLSNQKPGSASIVSRERLLQVARAMKKQEPRHFALISPLIRSTDMQSSVACAWLLVCSAFHGALGDAGANAERTILQALGLSYLGFNMPGLTQMQRTLYIEFVRTAVLFNVVGDQLCRPFGGGKARIQARQLVGIRAVHAGGLTLNNLRAMLEAGDARTAVRRRNPSTFVEFMEPTMDQDNLEIGFCVLWVGAGGCKPDLYQCLASMDRNDLNESYKSDCTTNFDQDRRGKQPGMYGVHARQMAREFNSGTSAGPRAPMRWPNS